MAIVRPIRSERDDERGTVAPDFPRKVARLGWSENDPWLVKELPTGHGIAPVICRHLPKMYPVGAGLRQSGVLRTPTM